MSERTKSEAFFRMPPMNYNCAQSLYMGWKNEFSFSDEDVEKLAPIKGGKAPGGLCGALYAANLILDLRGLPHIDREFEEVAGATTCAQIKSVTRYPCQLCVRLADELVEKRLGDNNKK